MDKQQNVNKEDPMQKVLMQEAVDIIVAAQNQGLALETEQPIPYGLQLAFIKAGYRIMLNLYYSRKKGISRLVGGSPSNPLRPILEQIVDKRRSQNLHCDLGHDHDGWVGSDESGKGDFFGPLVAAAFYCTRADLDTLAKLGVRDCKDLREADVVRITHRLYQLYPDRIEVLLLKPQKYNELYARFFAQGKKLNELLAWMHGRVIGNLAQKHRFTGVIIDKFAADSTLRPYLKGLEDHEIITRTKAESDAAVAAASILARYHFVQGVKSLEQQFCTSIPLGASAKVVEAARRFAALYGKERLPEVAKANFKTLNEI